MFFANSRFWLLDFFGHVVDHDGLRDCLFSVTPPPGCYPGLFFFSDDVSQEQFPVSLRKVVSLPMPLPPLKATRLPSGLVTLQRTDGSGRFLRSVENAGIDFQATEAKDWEHFLILSEAMMHGYAILSQATVSTLSLDGVGTLPPMIFAEGHNGRIGDILFSLAENLGELEKIASLAAGEEAGLLLKPREGETITLNVKRS